MTSGKRTNNKKPGNYKINTENTFRGRKYYQRKQEHRSTPLNKIKK